MLQVKSAHQWWPPKDKELGKPRKGSHLHGIIFIPGREVVEATRGIKYNHPGGWFAQTWMGNIQMAGGDWLVICGSGNRYVIKQADYWPNFGFRVGLLQKLLGLFK